MDLRKGIKVVEIEGKRLDLKKGKFGYRIVHPIQNEDGSMNWFNLFTGGGWGNLFKIGAIVLILIFICWAYKNDVQTLVECCNTQLKNTINPSTLNNLILP